MFCSQPPVINSLKKSESESYTYSPWTIAPQAPLSWNSPGKNTGVGSHSLLQGIFPTQELNPCNLHCRQMLYLLSHQGSLINSQLPSYVTSLVAQLVKRLSAMWETRVWSLGREDLLEKEMATYSSILAWKIPWTEELLRLQSIRLQRLGHKWATSLFPFTILCKLSLWLLTWLPNGLPQFPNLGFPCGSAGKESACNAGDLGLIPGLGRSPGAGKGYPLQYSGLENSMDFIVHGIAKSRTRLSDFHFTFTSPLNT